MLYGYPAEAVSSNWVHESLCAAIRRIHEGVEASEGVPSWPELLPAEWRARLESRTGLRDRLQRYLRVVEGLGRKERKRILRALREQNAIDRLVSCSSECDSVEDLAEPVRGPARELFGFAFELLGRIEVRELHYACIYANSRYHVCPFCGCEYFDAPGAPRESLDHYLSYSRYPFAAANLRNLVPMGNKCNSRYKRAQDILRAADGARRRSFFPYGNIPAISVSLDDSVPFGGSMENCHAGKSDSTSNRKRWTRGWMFFRYGSDMRGMFWTRDSRLGWGSSRCGVGGWKWLILMNRRLSRPCGGMLRNCRGLD